jgi:RHS repeat-associated protein
MGLALRLWPVTKVRHELGRRTTMVDNSGTTTYAYDAVGRLVGTTQGGVEQRYQYDAVGNRTTMALVGTGTFSYACDEVNRLKTMVTPAGERYTQQYDADSRRTTLLLGLGSKREYRYDSVGRIATQIEYNAAGQRIYTMVDSYDAVGNRVKRVANGNPTTWLYDDAYRLTGQQKSGQTATFSYDNNSNLTTKWHQGGDPRTMVYDAADRLTTMQVGGTTGTMSWFSRGAMRNQYETGAIKATYSYTDINNNLTVAHDAAGLTTSTYDGDNLRRKIVSGSVTTTFVWDGSDYLQIKPSTGDATLLVVLDGEVVGHVKGSEKRDYIVDPLGSVVAYLNSSQTLTDQFEYWPYGEMVAEIEAGTEPLLWVGSLGYFRENDLRTYIRAREYRQDLGSWMQLDPLWPREHAYGYVTESPTSRVDPEGKWPMTLGVPGRCRKRGRPGLPAIIAWSRPCEDADREICNDACAPFEGTTRDEDGGCLCFCVPVWEECGLIEILLCKQFCKRAGVLYDKYGPLPVNAKFTVIPHCHCKHP